MLALHTAALGGYLGFALQRSTGSDDARLTYPLAALGAGIGVGAAMVVADEWNVDVPQAWFLGAGMLWPGVSTLLIVNPEDADRPGGREMLGVVGAIGGVTLATAGLVLGDVTDGGAALTHSGAGLGLLLGGLGEMVIIGDTDATPRRGLGLGCAEWRASRRDGGHAARRPLGDGRAVHRSERPARGPRRRRARNAGARESGGEPHRDRIWLSGIIVGTIAGATLSFWAADTEKSRLRAEPGRPATGCACCLSVGWMGHPVGLGLTGLW